MTYLHGDALVTAAKAHVGKREYSSMCQAFCVLTAKIGAKGDFDGDRDADAVDGWKKAKARGKVVEAANIKNLSDIPAGTIAYWTGGSRGYGHAAITLNQGKVVSTDAPTWGQIGIVTIDWIAKNWGNGLKFVGYIIDDGDGHVMVDTTQPGEAIWGKPETWRIGATGADVTKLGQRIRVHSAALGLPEPYKVGPGSPFTQTDVDALSKIQAAWGDRDHDGYPGPLTFQRLAADPAPKPPPPSTPVLVTSVSQNFAGNNATGIRTAKSRIAAYIAARKAVPVDIINAQECTVASTVRPRLDSGLKPLGYTRANGGKGRYTYPRNSVTVIAHGLITTPSSTWWKGDDKQAAWVVYEKAGIRAMDVSLHLESDIGAGPDAKRVEQAVNIVSQALSIAAANRVDPRNVLVAGDTNSNKMVLDALVKKGWRNCAAGTKYENARTFMGWDGKKRDRYDYALVRKEAGPAQVVSVSDNTAISDHAGLRVERELTA